MFTVIVVNIADVTCVSQILFVYLTLAYFPSGAPYFPPYGADAFPPPVIPGRDYGGGDYDDYSPVEGSRSGFRERTPAGYGPPDGAYPRPDFG